MKPETKCPICDRNYGEDPGDCFSQGTPTIRCYQIALAKADAQILVLERELAEARHDLGGLCGWKSHLG